MALQKGGQCGGGTDQERHRLRCHRAFPCSGSLVAAAHPQAAWRPKKEALRGQYAVTREHITRLHQLHSDPGAKIKAGKPLGDGTRTIEYKWRRGGRTHHLVEEVRADTLVPRTFFITNPRGLVVMAIDAPPARESPSKTSETDHDLTNAATILGRCKLLADLLSASL